MHGIRGLSGVGLLGRHISTSCAALGILLLVLSAVTGARADVGCADSAVFAIDNVAKLVCADSAEFAIDNHAVGDLTCDGADDFGDINPFVLVLSNPAQYYDAYPACNAYNGDMNCDGTVDFGDINPFVACLTSGDCDCP